MRDEIYQARIKRVTMGLAPTSKRAITGHEAKVLKGKNRTAARAAGRVARASRRLNIRRGQ